MTIKNKKQGTNGTNHLSTSLAKLRMVNPNLRLVTETEEYKRASKVAELDAIFGKGA